MNQATNEAKVPVFAEAAAYVLRETFEGSPPDEGSVYLDPGVGLFDTLGGVDAAKASRSFKGSTITSHAAHAKFYLDRLCEFMDGRTEKVNWEASWLIETVDEEEWAALQMTMRKTYEDTMRCFAGIDDWTEDRVAMAIGMVAHTAYHLGAIRQMAKSDSAVETNG